MKISTILICLGILLYVVSFFLIAVKNVDNDAGFSGYWCALTTLTAPWGSEGLKQLRQAPLDFFSVLLSGWINPLFLIVVIVRWISPRSRLGWILFTLVLLMFPACWIVFARAHLRPSSGYFVWTMGMLMALLAGAFARSGERRPTG